MIKVKIGQAQDEWLDVEGNLDAWEGDPNATYKLEYYFSGIGKGVFFMILVDAEWELVKFH